MKKRLYDILLWVLRWMRAEKRVVQQLNSVEPENIENGMVYEHYGRLLIAEKVSSDPVVTYRIYLTEESSAKAYKVLSDGSVERMEDGGYRTADGVLARAMQENGCTVNVCEDMCQCHRCACYELAIPCQQGCDGRHVFRYHSMKPQNATNQAMYARIMARRIGR